MKLITIACAIRKHKVCPGDVTDNGKPAGRCACPCHYAPTKTQKL